MSHYRHAIKQKGAGILKYSLLVILIGGEITFHLWFFVHGEWDLTTNLPLQLSSLSLYLCAIMLITNHYKMFEVTFFISVVGGFIAMITPELFFGFPHMRFFHFFIVHAAMIASSFYMVWIEGFKATARSVIRSFITLNIIAAFVFMVNQLIDANYMFLAGKPSNVSVIDFLGPYPWYIIPLEIIAFTSFWMLYFIYFKANKKQQTTS